tara:strand:- start:465 stop:1064 length:600 start_codon:yes stop_codon:yes gene_type:complete
MKRFLHIGPGDSYKSNTSKIFATDEWEEVRLDINEKANPDILTSMTDLSMIEDDEYQGIFSSHNIEHIFPHEVDNTFREFFRVLSADGELVIICPDLMVVAKAIVEGNYLKALYESPAGPIAPIDILYGHRASIAAGNEYMAHKCAFTIEALMGVLKAAGFGTIVAGTGDFNLYALAMKPENLDKLAEQRLRDHLPLGQ